jgi:ABC-2 type transport system permease protein
MRTLKFLLQKEFKQIFRDPAILRVIFIIPLIQLLLLPWAADYEIKHIKLAIVDNDHSTYSQKMISKIVASGYFRLSRYSSAYNAALVQVQKDKADVIIEIPSHFEKDLVRENEATLFLSANAINGVKALLGISYLQSIIRDYNTEIREEWIQMPRLSSEIDIEVIPSNWYNELLDYKHFMVPGILVLIITIIGSFLTSMNIVREKEKGTIEQINVTPIKRHQFILGKLIPFWVIGLIVLTVGLFVSWLLYRILPVGSFVTIYVFAAAYLLVILGLGLLISNFSSTQQQSMLVTFFFFMIFNLLGGVWTPIDSMPVWAQWFTKINPVAYFIDVMRHVVLKGSNLADISGKLITILIYAFLLNLWAVYSYRKRAA